MGRHDEYFNLCGARLTKISYFRRPAAMPSYRKPKHTCAWRSAHRKPAVTSPTRGRPLLILRWGDSYELRGLTVSPAAKPGSVDHSHPLFCTKLAAGHHGSRKEVQEGEGDGPLRQGGRWRQDGDGAQGGQRLGPKPPAGCQEPPGAEAQQPRRRCVH